MINFVNIRNVIFDLGGVLVEISHQRCVDEFQKIINSSSNKKIETILKLDIFNKIETSSISETKFRDVLRENIKSEVSNDVLNNVWNKMLVAFNKEAIEVVEEVAKQKRVFLLSNTNIIHWRKFNKMFEADTGGRNFGSLFEKTYYSYELKMRKPNSNIFKYVLKDADLKPQETLFIDDTLENIKTAEQLGMITLHYNENEKNLREWLLV